MNVSECRVYVILGQHRSTQRHRPGGRADKERLVADMIKLTRQYGRCSYRRIAVLLRDDGWQVNDKHVERLWRWEGLKVPMKQPTKCNRMYKRTYSSPLMYLLRKTVVLRVNCRPTKTRFGIWNALPRKAITSAYARDCAIVWKHLLFIWTYYVSTAIYAPLLTQF